MSEWSLYLMLKLDTIRCILIVLGFCCLAFLLVLCAIIAMYVHDYNYDHSENEQISFKKHIITYHPKLIVIIGITIIIFGNLIPTTKQIAAIYIVPRITQNEKVQQIPEKALNILDKWLDEISLRNNEKTIKAESNN